MKTLAKPTNHFTRVLYTPIQSGLASFLMLAAIAAGLVVLRFVPQLRDAELTRVVGPAPRTGLQVGLAPSPPSMAVDDSIGPNSGSTLPPIGEYYVGVYVESLDPALAAQLKLKQGIVVRHIVPGSPAEAAGLQPNDLLLTAGDAPLDQVCSLGAAINQVKESELAIEVLREGQSLKVAMIPTKRPAQMWIPPALETASVEQTETVGAGKWVYNAPTATATASVSADAPNSAGPSAPTKTEQPQTDQAAATELKKAIEKLEQELAKAHEEVKTLKAKLAEQKKEN